MLRLSVFLTLSLCLSVTCYSGDDQKGGAEKVLFGDLPAVEAVALHAQSLAEAPANVTVITAAEIRRYGYRTLGEVLASVRGFYVTYDHEYHYVGVRGISLPGDFNTRFLVMLNGHPLTDNIYDSNGFFGQDFGLDLSLVERIEIIRGPTSALYGSNGILANINVVTMSPVDGPRLSAAAETGSWGEKKVSLASALYLGRGANLLVSGSVLHNRGTQFASDGLAVPAGTRDPVSNADGERGYHTFANLIWRNWSLTAYFNSREKQVPIGIGSSYSLDPGQHIIDARNFVSAGYKRSWGPGRIQWQIAYDQYRYQDRYDYPDAGGMLVVSDVNRGDWLDSQLAYDLPIDGVGPLTVGVAGTWETRAQQYNVKNGARENYSNHPDREAALFAQQEWKIASGLKLDAGLRWDQTRNFGKFVSPRLALVWQQSERTAYKLVYGRPFRNPSVFEQFYNDGGLSYQAAPALRPESASTFEASIERRLSAGWTLVANAYHYRVRDVIDAVDLGDSVQQYRNTGSDRSSGVELEVTGKIADRWEVSASNALGGATDSDSIGRLANSPARITKLRLGVPLWRERLFLAGDLLSVSGRNSWSGDRLGGATIAGFTATARLNRHCDLQAGLRNAFDRHHEDPIYLALDRLRGDGRSVFLTFVWRPWE